MQGTIRKGLFAALAGLGLFLGGPSPAKAEEVLFRNGYSEIIYNPEEILELRMKMGIKTIVLLPSDETISKVVVGIRGSIFEAKAGANFVEFRPQLERIKTNMHICCKSGRVYSFLLRDVSEDKHALPHIKVVVVRPDMDIDVETGGPAIPSGNFQGGGAQNAGGMGGREMARTGQPQAQFSQNAVVDQLPLAPGQMVVDPQLAQKGNTQSWDVVRRLDHNYKIQHADKKVFEIRDVYSDGERTMVVFKTLLNEAPLFFDLQPGGKREQANFRIEEAQDHRDPDVFVIDRLVRHGVVKVGNVEAEFTWKK